MTPDAQCVPADASIMEAAGMMRQLNVGALPICEQDQVTGIVTDRDLVLRALAEGLDPRSTCVREVMSPGVIYVFEDDSADEAARVMQEHQIRRLPVLDENKQLVGIISLGDVAVERDPEIAGEVLRGVSAPAEPVR